MKTLLLAVCSLIALNAQALMTEFEGFVDSPVTKRGDTTIIELNGSRILIVESEGEGLDVRIEDSETGEEEMDMEDMERDIEEAMKELEKLRGKKDDNDEDDDDLKKVRTRFLMFQLGVNGFINNEGEVGPPVDFPELDLRYGKSINVNLHLLRQRVNLINNVLNLEYGLWFQFNNYSFEQQITLAPDQPVLTTVEFNEPVKKSKLAADYLNIPLLLNLETNPHNKKQSFHLSVGGYGGFLLSGRTKYKTEDNEKAKYWDDFNLQKLQYGLLAEVGYGWFNLYCSYGLNTLFANGEGPALSPAAVGLTIVGF